MNRVTLLLKHPSYIYMAKYFKVIIDQWRQSTNHILGLEKFIKTPISRYKNSKTDTPNAPRYFKEELKSHNFSVIPTQKKISLSKPRRRQISVRNWSHVSSQIDFSTRGNINGSKLSKFGDSDGLREIKDKPIIRQLKRDSRKFIPLSL